MASTQATALSLFSGIAGLDLGWELATGGRVVGYCERDAYAASVLLARMEDQALEPAPIWCGDIADLDVTPFLGVDWVIGGFPCQDISVAGRGVGIDGKRSGLWSELFRAYRDTGARWLFVENVAAITFRGLDRVLADLAGIWCSAQWLCLRASELGAPHRRKRWFLLADRDSERLCLECCGGLLDCERPTFRHHADRCGQIVANTARQVRRGRSQPQCGLPSPAGEALVNAYGCRPTRQCGTGEAGAAEPGCSMGHAISQGLEEWTSQRIHDRAQCETAFRAGDFPPGPGDEHRWREVVTHAPHLAPAVEPGVRRLVDGLSYVVDASRADRLRCLGNAVVPLQAAAALVELMRRMN